MFIIYVFDLSIHEDIVYRNSLFRRMYINKKILKLKNFKNCPI